MKLFVIPNSITCEDGSDSIDIPVVTPEYIDRQIMNIEAVGKLTSMKKMLPTQFASAETPPRPKISLSQNSIYQTIWLISYSK